MRKFFNARLFYALKSLLYEPLYLFIVKDKCFSSCNRCPLPEDLGYFSIAAQMADVFALLPTTIALILFPELIKKRAIIIKLLSSGFKKFQFDNACFMFSRRVFSRLFILKNLFRGEVFAGCGNYKIYTAWLLFYSILIILTQYLAANGLPRLVPIIWFLEF